MKISIITVCFNSANTVADTINSVNSQSYNLIENICWWWINWSNNKIKKSK